MTATDVFSEAWFALRIVDLAWTSRLGDFSRDISVGFSFTGALRCGLPLRVVSRGLFDAFDIFGVNHDVLGFLTHRRCLSFTCICAVFMMRSLVGYWRCHVSPASSISPCSLHCIECWHWLVQRICCALFWHSLSSSWRLMILEGC